MASIGMTVESNTSTTRYEYEWKIKNFFNYYDVLRGAEFSPLQSIPLKFVLELEPHIIHCAGYPYYKFNLVKLSEEEIPKTCRVEIVVKVHNGPVLSNTVTAASTVGRPCTVYDIKSLCIFTAYLYNDNHLYFDEFDINVDCECVSFLCTFTFFGHNITTVINSSPALQMSNKAHDNICSDLKDLYESKNKSDIYFKIGKDILKAHQCILAARSPVFKGMFESNLTETNSKCIQIADFDARIFDCFLKYLYCGDIEDTSFDTVMRLFSLADKYNVDSLLKDCSTILDNKLSIYTACRIAVLSYLHCDKQLKDKSIRYICHHFSALKNNAEWRKTIEDYPKLASEVFSVMTDYFK